MFYPRPATTTLSIAHRQHLVEIDPDSDAYITYLEESLQMVTGSLYHAGIQIRLPASTTVSSDGWIGDGA
jgi:hypothetical protein